MLSLFMGEIFRLILVFLFRIREVEFEVVMKLLGITDCCVIVTNFFRRNYVKFSKRVAQN